MNTRPLDPQSSALPTALHPDTNGSISQTFDFVKSYLFIFVVKPTEIYSDEKRHFSILKNVFFLALPARIELTTNP